MDNKQTEIENGSNFEISETAVPSEALVPSETADPSEAVVPSETADPSETLVPSEKADLSEAVVPGEAIENVNPYQVDDSVYPKLVATRRITGHVVEQD